MFLSVMLKTFLKTNEGKQIIILEDKGYKLTNLQKDLTIPQELFLAYGWDWLDKEKEKEYKKQQQKANRKGR